MQGQLDPNSPVPRYYQIYSALLAMIQQASVGTALPPERQIAEHFGVARPTVVKALDLLEREGLLEKQQGRGNIVIKPGEKGESQIIAFVSSPNFTHELVMGISQTAFANQFQLQMLGVDIHFADLKDYLDSSLKSGVQGFIIYGRPGTKDIAVYQQLLAQKIPVVMLDRYYPELDCDHVVYNNAEASYQLTQKLLERGHQTIAIIPGAEIDTTAVKDRLKGYQKALETAGIPFDEDLIWLDLYHYSKHFPDSPEHYLYQELLWQRLEYHKPGAIIAINDMIVDQLEHDLLFLAMQQRSSTSQSSHSLSELGYFGVKPKLNYRYVKVIAIHPTFDLGKAAASLLISRIKNVYTDAKQHLMIPMTVVDYAESFQQNPQTKEVAGVKTQAR